MVNENIVLILGAGASAHLGYPLGTDLRNKIITNLHLMHNHKQYRKLFTDLQYAESDVIAFVDAFHKSGTYSIDAFLESRTEFMDIGKIAIAQVLIPFESDNKLFDSYDNWYAELELEDLEKYANEAIKELLEKLNTKHK